MKFWEGEKDEEGKKDQETNGLVTREAFEALQIYFVWNLMFIWFWGECRRVEKEGEDNEYE